MKKLLLVVLTVLMCSASFAQFRTQTLPRETVAPKGNTDLITWGQIGTPFVATDINGNTVDLAAILNSGMSVVIDYSACWCGPCWNFHQAGVLEAINSMDSVQVIWVEIESTNTLQQIYGTTTSNGYDGYTYGNWTVDANNNPVSYPIIDDDASRTCLNTCYSLYEGYVPSVYYIAPSGYFCSIYGESYGVSSFSSSTQAIQAIQNIMNSAPRAGQAPIVEISGFSSVLANSTATFTANYISVDPVTDVTWTFSNGNPATATGQIASTTWSNTGNETVTLTVTNTTGSTTATLNVNVFEYNWGDVMDYPGNGTMESALGSSNGITWGVKYPATYLAGRNYVDYVQLYSANDGHVTLKIYETTADSPTDNDLVYQYTYPVTDAEDYITFPIYDRVAIDNTKDLWVAFTCNDISYPAAWTTFNGDNNTDMIYFSTGWQPLGTSYPNYIGTWMIKTATSATAPAMTIAISAPTEATGNQPVSFTAAGPAAATFNWSFDGGNPATATGMTATTTFTTAGDHTVTLTATLDGETATATHTINIAICDAQNLPWSCGFEDNDNLGCWKFYDQDGDGYGWDAEKYRGNTNYVHTGNGVIGSASFINNIGALSPDNWMITPELVIPAEGATLSYYVGPVDANYYQEYYSILVSTTGSNPSDFTYTVFAGTVDRASWVKKSRSLAGFAGQTIRIAFRHYNSHDVFWMLIDDIEVTPGNTASIDDVNDINVALYPNPVCDKLNIVAEGIQEVNVLDINGRVVVTETNTNTIDMSNLANGVYFVRVITANGVSTQKIVKK